jgi:hypothetical protein
MAYAFAALRVEKYCGALLLASVSAHLRLPSFFIHATDML